MLSMWETEHRQQVPFVLWLSMENCPPPSQRPLAISFLVLANLLIAMGSVSTAFLLPPRMGSPMAVTAILGGLLVGQLLWLTLWASLSDARLFFRWGLLASAVCAAIFGITLLPSLLQLFSGIPFQTAFGNGRWRVVMQAFLQVFPPCLAFSLAIYAILLPYRRLRGLSVGTGAKDKNGDPRSRQFRIIDLMAFSLIVAAPLALIRSFARGEQLLIFLLFFALLVAGGLLFGVPVFFASLAGRRSIIWAPLSICFVLALGWTFGECTFWIYGSAGGLAVDFRVWAALLLPGAIIICLNNLCLQVLGIRLHQGKRVAIAPSSE
jgi:hypothetical protein